LSLRTILILAAVAAAAPAHATQVWTALASEKIRPSAAARETASAGLTAARNEFEAFQIILTGAASNVRASAGALTGAGTIAGVRLYREALINLAYPSALDGATGRWPDALVPAVDELTGEVRNAFPFSVPAGESRAVWVEVHVPHDATPGEYSGAVRVTWDGGEATVPVALTVWPFTLPSTASLKSAFGLSYGTLVTAHGVTGDALSTLRARYGQLALDHRVTLPKIDDGNRDLTHFSSFFGSQLDGTSPATLPGARATSVEYLGGAGGLASWESFFDGKGWMDRLYQYTCDEPPITCAWSDIPARARAAKAVSPDFRTLVTTTIQEADEHGVTSSIDVMVPVVNYLDDRPAASRFSGPQRSRYDAFLASSPLKELWTYQSCMSHGCGGTVNMGSPSDADRYFTGWPSYVIDASAVRNRAMEWLSFLHGVGGELYFETTMAYGHDPWNNQWDFTGNGDGTLFYPGTPAKIGGSAHVPVASIRLKMVREGMEDYEYLKLLSDAGDAPLAQRIAGELFPHAYQTDVSPADLMAARERIARRIVELTGGVPNSIPSLPGAEPVAEPGTSGTPALTTASVQGGGCHSGAGGALALAGVVASLLRRRRRS
jgi:MYXO-CTERM domain-containing protein